MYVIAPASANTIAKLAAGLADNLLSSCALAATLPAGARARDEQPHVRAPRDSGEPARRCASAARSSSSPTSAGSRRKGEEGVGRLAAPARILDACVAALAGEAAASGDGDGAATDADSDGRHGVLAGLRVLVTAGGTREPIDSVRFIGNSSSGRMGFALAQAARERGAEVTLVAANVALATPPGRAAPRRRHRSRARAGVRAGVPQLRRAADDRRRRRLHARGRRERQDQEGGPRAPGARAGADGRRARGVGRRNGARARRSSASPPSTAPRRSSSRAPSSPPRASTRSSSTTSPAPTSASTWTPTRSRSSPRPPAWAPRSASATCRARARRRSPTRSSTRSRGCAASR